MCGHTAAAAVDIPSFRKRIKAAPRLALKERPTFPMFIFSVSLLVGPSVLFFLAAIRSERFVDIPPMTNE